MTLANFETLFLLFFIYSVGGWLIESVGSIFTKKKFVNRGFLIGPYCPIYGIGVVLITIFLSRYKEDPVALFFLSAVLCGVLEYLTSYLMEKIFKARWWDYSDMKFNINGRICLETLVLFAFAGVIILRFTNPAIESVLALLSPTALHIFSGIFLFIFLIDCIVSLNVMNSVKTIKISLTNQIKDNTDEISAKVREILMNKSIPYRRLLSAFPQAFADRLKESKEKIEKTAEKVKEDMKDAKERALENLQEVKEKALDNLQEVKDKTIDGFQNMKEKTISNIQETKEKVFDNLQDMKSKTLDVLQNSTDAEKFLKKYKRKTKLSLMKIYRKK